MDCLYALATNIRQTTGLFASCDDSSIGQRWDALTTLDSKHSR
jgi:hypothetical protein